MEYRINNRNRNNNYSNNKERKANVLKRDVRKSVPSPRKGRTRNELGWIAVDEADLLVHLMRKRGLPLDGVHRDYHDKAFKALLKGRTLPPFKPWLGYEPKESEWGDLSGGLRKQVTRGESWKLFL